MRKKTINVADYLVVMSVYAPQEGNAVIELTTFEEDRDETVTINDRTVYQISQGTFRREVTINWSALGSVTLKTAERHAALVAYASQLMLMLQNGVITVQDLIKDGVE
jgi:hypothetical protein